MAEALRAATSSFSPAERQQFLAEFSYQLTQADQLEELTPQQVLDVTKIALVGLSLVPVTAPVAAPLLATIEGAEVSVALYQEVDTGTLYGMAADGTLIVVEKTRAGKVVASVVEHGGKKLGEIADPALRKLEGYVENMRAPRGADQAPIGTASSFYEPQAWRQNYEEFYGEANISSTTVPPFSAKMVHMAGKRHPKTDVVFDQRGFPIFDRFSEFDTRLPLDEFTSASYQTQMRMATRDLRI